MNKKDSRFFNKSIIAFSLMTFFFVAIIFIYYIMLGNVTEERITRECELNAEVSSGKIDNYLTAGSDCINITEGSLNSMIREKRPSDDILDYLLSQTRAVESVLPEATTGVYGYINGEYLDGDGWVPDEGYDPVTRPWYIQAKASMGQMVVVDPYLDAQTGEMIITLAKELCDAKSVVALDLSLRELQKITEEITEDNEIIMVLDKDYYVIAHSDRSQINKDYLNDDGSLGNAIVNAYRASAEDSFRANYGGTEYIVHSKKLDNSWICFCATDTTDARKALLSSLILTILISVIVICFIIVVLVYSDKRRRHTEELEEMTRIAVAANNAKTAFLANMSHEIRTPINSILGMNEMVLRESRDEDILAYSRNIKSAGSILLGLVNDVLDFSKIESGKIEIIPTEYELSSVVNDLVNMIRVRADEKGLKLVLEIDGDIPNRLIGDEIRIKQIITNLLTNAVKYTSAGSVTFGMRYRDDTDDPESIELEVFVKDTGVGIRPGDMDKLFVKFERLEEKKNRNIEGTGLGLSISQSLLEHMGSSLKVDSEYGKGSVFSFAVIQKVAGDGRLKDHETCSLIWDGADRNIKESFVAPSADILVVDDNSMNLEVFRSLVKRNLVKTDTADSGAEGISKSSKKKYDMIFLDHMMPEKDGIETLIDIRRDTENPNSDTPVICLTANAIAGAREVYIDSGFDEYLSKPIDPDRLEDIMIRYLPPEKVTRVRSEAETAADAGDMPEELTGLQGTVFDVEAGIAGSGSPEAYISLLKVFDDIADDRGSELDRLLEEEDFENYTIKIHAMKSSLGLIGVNGLAEYALELEKAGKNKDYDVIRRDHGKFMKEFRSVRELLIPLFADDDCQAGEKPVAEEGMLSALYDEMRKAADEMDCDTLEKAMEELSMYTIPPEHEQRVEQLSSAVKGYKYETVLTILDGTD